MTQPLVVVDASVALAWYLPDTIANLKYAAAVREARTDNRIISLVPDVWAAEIAYRLLKLSRTKRPGIAIELAQIAAFLDRFPQSVHATPRSVSEIVGLAIRYHLQSWDALYFDAAVRHGAMLATLDGGLKTACRTFKIALWVPTEHAISAPDRK